MDTLLFKWISLTLQAEKIIYGNNNNRQKSGL